MKRSASETRRADWFKSKRAVVGIVSREMAVAVTKKGSKGSQETSIQEVDLYVVNVLVIGYGVSGDPEYVADKYEKVLGSPGGTIDELLHVAMKKYPLNREPHPNGLLLPAIEDPAPDEPIGGCELD